MNKHIIQHIEEDTDWDNGELGRNEEFARAVSLSALEQAQIDEATGLQMISIRLPVELIEAFKFIGSTQGIRYQTLMRQVLARFADAELKSMARKAATTQIKARQAEEMSKNQERRKTG